MCESAKLEKFLDLGLMPIVDNFLSAEQLVENEPFYPLNVHLCKNCGLSQLGFKVPPTKLFHADYAYESGTTIKRKENYTNLAKYICKIFACF